MRDSRGLLILLALVVVVATVVWFATRLEPVSPRPTPEEDQPIRFRFSDVKVKSPDLEVVEPEVRGAIRTTYSSWLVTLNCAEPEGCAGEFAIEVRYHTGSDSERIVIATRCDVPNGAELRFEGLQDSPTPVDHIEYLTLEVLERGVPGQSTDEGEL